MLDFLKFSIIDNGLIRYLENHTLLDWVQTEDKINLFDIEVIKTKTIKEYKGIYFCIYSNRIDVLFKPHYCFNNNLHNSNNFKVIDCINTVLGLQNALNIDLNLLKVVNIEFGLNVVSPIDVKKLIAYIIYHEKNEFKTDVGLAFSKKSYKANTNGSINSYKIIKAYAKGLQFSQYTNKNTFRFEIKSKQSKYINKLGIYSANDLLHFDCYANMTNEIIKEFDKVLLLDYETDFSSLKQSEQSKIMNYLNTITWFKISQDSYRNRFQNEKTKYYNLINKVENNLKNQLDKIIFKKLEFLKSGAISTHSRNIKSSAISNIYKGGICTKKENSVIALLLDKKEELKNSYQEQKKAIAEHNRLAVIRYNQRMKTIINY